MKLFSFKSKQQKGMTLIEIMISMFIGLFLVAGVMQMFVSTKLSYGIQDAVARINENSRFSLEMLSGNIRMAGYRINPEENSTEVFTASTLFPRSGQFVSGNEGGDAQADQVNIRFQGSVDAAGVADGRVFDCEGTSIGNTLVELSFTLSGTDFICTINGATPIDAVLAENVTNFQVLYGLSNGSDESVNQYVKASSLLSSDWNKVVSLKLGMVFSSEASLASNTMSFPSISDSPVNAVFDNNTDGQPDLFKTTPASNFNSKTAPDKRIYKVYTTTVVLRNRIL